MKQTNYSVGIDCCEIDRFNKIIDNQKLLNKIFTLKEINYCQKRISYAQCFAVRFSAKEAIQKAIDARIPLNKIEIINQPNGNPNAKILKQGYNNWEIKISLSHTQHVAFAVALAYLK